MKLKLIPALMATTLIVGTAGAQTTEPKTAPGTESSAPKSDTTPGRTAPRNVGPATGNSGPQGQVEGLPGRRGQPQIQGTQKDTTADKPEPKSQGDKSQAQERGPDARPSQSRDGDANARERAKEDRDAARKRAQDQGNDRDRERNRANDNRREAESTRDRVDTRGDGSRDRGDARDRQSPSDRQTGSITERQETSIRQAFARENIRRTTKVNFNISVGTVLPRSVTVYPLPASIVQIAPQYRGYRYIAVEDEIIIVHPRTYRIVTVLPLEGSRQARSGGRRVEFSSSQRQRIRSFALQECRTVVAAPSFDLRVGVVLPEAYDLCPFDEVILRDVQVVRPYRYMIVQDEVVLVDPSTNMIVEVIR